MGKKKEVTYYSFYSALRSFLGGLIKNPVSVKLPEVFSNNGISKKELINALISYDVLERHEKIRDQFNSDEEKPMYYVKYKVRKKNFERKSHRLYTKFFEKDSLNECDSAGCGCDNSGDCLFGSGNASAMDGDSQRGGYEAKLGFGKKKNKKDSGVLRMRKNIYLTESQMNYINEFFNTVNAGDDMLYEDEVAGATNTDVLGNSSSTVFPKKKNGKNIAGGLVLTTGNGKLDPAYGR